MVRSSRASEVCSHANHGAREVDVPSIVGPSKELEYTIVDTDGKLYHIPPP